MSAPHLILCGGARVTSKGKIWADAHKVPLTIGRGPKAIHLRTDDIPARLNATLTDRALDLLEIAAYVFTADQACSRGGDRSFEYGETWRRHFRFEVPVRDVDFWTGDEVRGQLEAALGFLSDDDYEFAFARNKHPAAQESYLHFRGKTQDANPVEEVMLFSGGLDSLAGAVQEIVAGHRRVALVSHVSSTKVGKRQRDLCDELRKRAVAPARAPLPIPLRLNKGKSLGIDSTQRTRSFVFSSIAAVVAIGLGLHRIRFYENGPISFNFPMAGELVGGRASRTTHPRSVHLLRSLLRSVFGETFEIDNPFLWNTRAEIMDQLRATGLSALCARTVSCAHTKASTIQHPHCGRCSQCLDRRMAALAIDLSDDDDPAIAYAASFDTPCRDAPHRTLVERYIGNSLRLGSLSSPAEFRTAVPEVARVLSSLPGPADVALSRVFDLHKRYAAQIRTALTRLVEREASRLVDHKVSAESPLGIILQLKPPVVGGPAPVVQTPSTEGSQNGCYGRPTADHDTFTVRFGNAECHLGNTMAFRFFATLAGVAVGHYLHVDKLMADVWDGECQKNSIHRCVSALRKALKAKGGFEELIIDGSERNHYAFKISANGKG